MKMKMMAENTVHEGEDTKGGQSQKMEEEGKRDDGRGWKETIEGRG